MEFIRRVREKIKIDMAMMTAPRKHRRP